MNDNLRKIVTTLSHTYCRLKKSDIEGVGVVAIRDIPKNTNPFYGVRKNTWHAVSRELLKKELPEEVMKMADDFFSHTEKGDIEVPDGGLNGIDTSFFLNESDSPNVEAQNGGESFVTSRDIKKGEELTVSYKTYDAHFEK